MRYADFKITEMAMVASSSPASIPTYIDGINNILKQPDAKLKMGKTGDYFFTPNPGQQIKDISDTIQGTGQDHLGKDVTAIVAKNIFKSPAIKGGESGKKEDYFGNKGEVAEGILGCATMAKLIKRPGADISSADILNVIGQLPDNGELIKTAAETESNITDKFTLVVKLKPDAFKSLRNTELLSKKMSKEINSIKDYINDAVRRYSKMFEVNGRPDAVDIISDGISNEVGTKTDVELVYNNEKGKRVVKNFDLSVKTGTTKQMGQVGSGGARMTTDQRFDILKNMWTRFGVDIDSVKGKFVKAKNIEDAYDVAYIEANRQIQQELAGSSEDEEKRFLKQMVDGIKYFATLNDDKVRLVQFTQKGYYVLDFKRLNKLFDQNKLNLTSRLVYGKSGDGIKLPKVIIYDNETNKDLLTIRMFRNAAGYIRNYIEKEALMVQLTKVRGNK
jgi:hypothetical protein